MPDDTDSDSRTLKWIIAITACVISLVLINLSIELTILLLR